MSARDFSWGPAVSWADSDRIARLAAENVALTSEVDRLKRELCRLLGDRSEVGE